MHIIGHLFQFPAAITSLYPRLRSLTSAPDSLAKPVAEFYVKCISTMSHTHTERSSTARVWPLAVRSSKANAAWISPVFAVEQCREILSRLMKRERASALPNRLLSERVSGKLSDSVREWVSESLHSICSTFWARFYLLSFGVNCLAVHWVLVSTARSLRQAQGVSSAIHCLQDALGCSSGDTLWLRFWAVMLLMLNFFWGTVKELKKKELEFKSSSIEVQLNYLYMKCK